MARIRYKPPEITDIVYLVTDPEKNPRLVTSFKVLPTGLILYELAFGEKMSTHYEFEITKEKETRSKTVGFSVNESGGNQQVGQPKRTKGKTIT